MLDIKTLANGQQVVVQRNVPTGDYHSYDIWEFDGERHVIRLSSVTKFCHGEAGVPHWDAATFSLPASNLTVEETPSFVSLIALAKSLAEQLDTEFVPGSEVKS